MAHAPSRSTPAQRCRFKAGDGQRPHEWRVTQVRIVFLTEPLKPREPGSLPSKRLWRGLYMFNPDDAAMALKLKDLIVAFDRPDPVREELYEGAGQIIRDLIYLIASNWLEFFNEADLHLKVMVNTVNFLETYHMLIQVEQTVRCRGSLSRQTNTIHARAP